MNNCFEDIQSLCRNHGTEYFGVADLTQVHDEVYRQGGDFVRPYSKAIVFGIVLQDSVVNLVTSDIQGAKSIYSHHAYQVINTRLDILTSRVADIIQKNGLSAFPVPASLRFDNERICSIFSHKLAARQAGFGWIGKSCMLITPEHGPRVRWGSVLTDAPFPAVSKPMDEQCGKCQACVDICPVQAFTGEPFREGESREVRYAAALCDQYFQNMKEHQEEPVCGLCLYVCPYGRKNR
jgi:epoxyqueuosine reductase QueG